MFIMYKKLKQGHEYSVNIIFLNEKKKKNLQWNVSIHELYKFYLTKEMKIKSA